MFVGLVNVFFSEMSAHVFWSLVDGVVCFFLVNVFKSPVNSGYQTFVRWPACKSFLPFCRLPVHSDDSFFWCAEALQFNQISFINFGFHSNCFWHFCHEVFAHAYVLNGIAQVFFQDLMVLGFTFKSLSQVNFCIRCKGEVQFQLSAYDQPVFPTLLNRKSFPYCFCWVSQRSDGCRCVALLPRSLFHSIHLYLCFSLKYFLRLLQIHMQLQEMTQGEIIY